MRGERIELSCCRCGYSWLPRKDEVPKRCPSCRSIKWNMPDLKMECTRCNHVWYAHHDIPHRCPSCGSAKWQEPLQQFSCPHCGHKWLPKGGRPPKRCPNCAFRDWNVSRRDTGANDPYTDEQMNMVEDLLRNGYNPVQISMEMKIPYSIVLGYINGTSRQAKRRKHEVSDNS